MTQAQESSLMTRDQKWQAAKRNRMFIEREILESRAWHSLRTGAACQVYMHFRCKCQYERAQCGAARRRKAFIHTNNGEMQFRYTEAAKWGFDAQKFTRAIDALVAVGLIDIYANPMGLHKEANLYGLSERWRQFGTDDFKVAVRLKRPEMIGFAKGNRYGQNCRKKKKSTVVNSSSTTVVNNSDGNDDEHPNPF